MPPSDNSVAVIIIIIIIINKRGFVRRNKRLFNSNTGPSNTKKKYILKQPDTDELRRCGKESETIQHITAAC